jgi:hypothetical protein
MSGKNAHLTTARFDKALEFKASKYYRLSIQLSPDGFSFCIYDNSRDKYAGIESWGFQDAPGHHILCNYLKDIFDQSEWLNQAFERTSIIYETPVSTLIPVPLFKKENDIDYLKFNHWPAEDQLIRNDHLPLLDAKNIWSIPQNVHDLLTHTFPKATIHHHASSLIESLLLLNKNSDAGEVVFVNVRKTWFDVVVLAKGKLLLFNAFKYRTKEDFIYYLIYVLEQLNLNPEKTDVVLLGEIMKISAVYEMTYKYVRNINFGGHFNDHQFSYVFDDIPAHFYFNLLHLQQCGL